MRLEGEYVKQWGELMAGYTISSIPLVIIFLFTMKMFVKGLSAGAVKG
jgi:ABC-type glycerol-3-phosphate transport system permease component